MFSAMKIRYTGVFYFKTYLSRGIKTSLVNCRLKLKQHEPLMAIYPRGRLNIKIVFLVYHYCDVKMSAIASQITSLTIVYSIIYSSADQRKHQSSASLAFVREIHRGPVNSPHKWPVTRKMVPSDDLIMWIRIIRFDGLETWHCLILLMPYFFIRCLQCSSPRSLANSYALISIRISRDNNISRDRMVIKLHYADICWRLRHGIIG